MKRSLREELKGLPKLPDGWLWVKIGELLMSPLSNGKSVSDKKGGFPVLRLTAINSGKIDLQEFKEGNWTEDDARNYIVTLGDFFLSRGNGSKQLVGIGGLVTTLSHKVAFPDTMVKLNISDKI